MTKITNIQELELVNLAGNAETLKTPLRVGPLALAELDHSISQSLEELEARFADFVTSDSISNSLKRNR